MPTEESPGPLDLQQRKSWKSHNNFGKGLRPRIKSDFISVPSTSSSFSITPFACLYHFLLKRRLESQVQVCKSESFKFIHVGGKATTAGLDKAKRKSKIERKVARCVKPPQISFRGAASGLKDAKVGVSETYAQPVDVVLQKLTTSNGQLVTRRTTRTETHQLDVSKSLSFESDIGIEGEVIEDRKEEEEKEEDSPYHEIYRASSRKVPYYSDVIPSLPQVKEEEKGGGDGGSWNGSSINSSGVSSVQSSCLRNSFNLSNPPIILLSPGGGQTPKQEKSPNRVVHFIGHDHDHRHYRVCEEGVKRVEDNWTEQAPEEEKSVGKSTATKRRTSTSSSSGIEIELNSLEHLYIRHNHKNLNPPNSIRHRQRKRKRRKKKKPKSNTKEEEEEEIVLLTTQHRRNHLNCSTPCSPYKNNNKDKNNYFYCSGCCCNPRQFPSGGCKRISCSSSSSSSGSDFYPYFHSRPHSMARKRYETAFLPSGQSSSDQSSPDVDSLLLAIESTTEQEQQQQLHDKDDLIHHQLPLIMRHTHIYNEQHDCDPSISTLRPDPNSPLSIVRPHLLLHHRLGGSDRLKTYSSSSPPPRPPPPILKTPSRPEKNLNIDIVKGDQGIVHRVDSSDGGWRDTRSKEREEEEEDDENQGRSDQVECVEGVSSKVVLNFDNLCSPRKLSPNLPLSEPLPIKRYANAHSSSCHGRGIGGSGDGKLLSGCDNRNLTKEYSISSLESLDSTQSEDLQMQLQTHPFSFSKLWGHHHHGGGDGLTSGGHKSKLLSPISDKSPLEPKSIQLGTEGHHLPGSSRDSQHLLNNSAELTLPNVPWDLPWECPKLKRKLALLADSGISLDFPSSSSSRPDFFGSHTSSNSSRVTRDFDLDSHPVGVGPSSSLSHGDRGSLDLKLPPRKDFTENIEERGNYLPAPSNKPDRGKVWLDFSGKHGTNMMPKIDFDPETELECQDWFHGAVTRSEAEAILRPTKEGSFIVRNCESSTNFNQYSLSIKCVRGFIHIRIEPNSLGTFSLGDQEFPSVPNLIQHFMLNRLPIKGAEHVKLIHPIGWDGGWL